MISKTNEQIYTIHYILEQNNRPGYRIYMPTYKHYYNTHLSCYRDMEYEAVDKRDHGWCVPKFTNSCFLKFPTN